MTDDPAAPAPSVNWVRGAEGARADQLKALGTTDPDSLVGSPPVIRLLWILPIAFALHELEEWHILDWYVAQWRNLPADQMTPTIVRTWLSLIAGVGFLWTYAGTRFRNPAVAAHVVLFFFILLPFGHTLAHLYWVVDLQRYHPGSVTALLLIIPATVYVAGRAVTARVVSVWYLGVVFLLSLPPTIEAVGLDYRIPDEGLAHYRLASWLVSLVA